MSSSAPTEIAGSSRPSPSRGRAAARGGPRAGSRPLPHRLGRYTLFDHIGRGGMADIYLAKHDTSFGASRLVVVKEVLASLAHNPRFAELLIAEAKLASQLGHANVVKVEDLGRDDGTLFIGMEYVEGFDLRELLRRCAQHAVPLPVEFSFLLVTEALRGLDYAHRFRIEGRPCPIVHRDVSPSNVLVSFDGEVKLCDFGIARAHDAANADLSRVSEGKAGYMSPEQARGDALDARADVFAAGIILWELLAGRRLYKAGEDEPLIEIARRAEIPALPARDLPNEAVLHGIVLRALGRHRDDRFPSAAAMLAALEEYAAAAQMVASPIRFGEWLMDHFGKDIVSSRRGRERALRAFELGPVARIEPIAVRGPDGVLTPLPPKVVPSLPFVAPPIEASEAEPVAANQASAAMEAITLPRAHERSRKHAMLIYSALVSLAIAVLAILASRG